MGAGAGVGAGSSLADSPGSSSGRFRRNLTAGTGPNSSSERLPSSSDDERRSGSETSWGISSSSSESGAEGSCSWQIKSSAVTKCGDRKSAVAAPAPRWRAPTRKSPPGVDAGTGALPPVAGVSVWGVFRTNLTFGTGQSSTSSPIDDWSAHTPRPKSTGGLFLCVSCAVACLVGFCGSG